MAQDDSDERDRGWSSWAGTCVVIALKDAGLLAAADEERAYAVAQAELFELLTMPRRWSAAFPGKTDD